MNDQNFQSSLYAFHLSCLFLEQFSIICVSLPFLESIISQNVSASKLVDKLTNEVCMIFLVPRRHSVFLVYLKLLLLKTFLLQFFNPPKCGNGYLEKGEECDCGTEEVKLCSVCPVFWLASWSFNFLYKNLVYKYTETKIC